MQIVISFDSIPYKCRVESIKCFIVSNEILFQLTFRHQIERGIGDAVCNVFYRKFITKSVTINVFCKSNWTFWNHFRLSIRCLSIRSISFNSLESKVSSEFLLCCRKNRLYLIKPIYLL